MSASSGYGGGSSPVGPVIETLTGNVGGPVGPTGNNINIIGAGGVLVTGNPGTSTLTITVSGIATLYTEDVGTATPAGGNLNILGGASTAGVNMHTFGSGNTVDIILNDSLFFPNTNGSGTQGVLFWGGNTFVHNFGFGNSYLGANAGNLTGIGIENVGIGTQVLLAQTASSSNTGVGYNTLLNLLTGGFNTSVGNQALVLATATENCIAIGDDSLDQLVDGIYNTCIGSQSGHNYTSNESNNIILGPNSGVLGDTNVMRLGLDGVGTGQQDSCYIGGVYQRSFGTPNGVVQIDSNFKLGSTVGSDGQVLIGANAGNAQWGNLTSVGGSVVITNGPNTINLEATGTGAGASAFPTDSGTANEAAGVLNVFGGAGSSGVNNIRTTGAGNTVHVILKDSLFFSNTNNTGTQGVLNWGGNRFIHDFGANNTFVGSNAGNLTLNPGLAVSNTAMGASAGIALTTGSENCLFGQDSGLALTTGIANVSLGFASLDNLTTGQANIAIGTLAGTNYTSSESNNILINNFGVVAESGVTRIGRNGVQTSAYMAGVYNSTIGTTNAPVFIDNTGKLGTIGGGGGANPAFLARLESPDGPYTNSTSTANQLGVNVPLTVVYDAGGNFFAGAGGGGSPANFTAPTTGLYQFNITIAISYSGLGSGGTTFRILLLTTTDNYEIQALPSETLTVKTVTGSICAVMNAGNIATFAVIASIDNPGGYTIYPSGDSGGATWATFVSGFKVL